jgi:hypothetical protein
MFARRVKRKRDQSPPRYSLLDVPADVLRNHIFLGALVVPGRFVCRALRNMLEPWKPPRDQCKAREPIPCSDAFCLWCIQENHEALFLWAKRNGASSKPLAITRHLTWMITPHMPPVERWALQYLLNQRQHTDYVTCAEFHGRISWLAAARNYVDLLDMLKPKPTVVINGIIAVACCHQAREALLWVVDTYPSQVVSMYRTGRLRDLLRTWAPDILLKIQTLPYWDGLRWFNLEQSRYQLPQQQHV